MIDGSRGGVIVMMKHVILSISKNGDEVIQGHEPVIRISVVELAEQLKDRVGRWV